ncbi:uncharacterized protein LOC144743357 [Ciona intestinalis]
MPARISDGGSMRNSLSLKYYPQALRECNLTAARYTFGFVVKVYSSLPAAMMRKTCPTWTEDIRPIFQLYYNLFPVMEKHNIINLRNIHDVRSQLHKINMSMFEFDWNHPNFMPTTRDLSPDKTEIVRRWLECEITGGQTDKQYDKLVRQSRPIENVFLTNHFAVSTMRRGTECAVQRKI